MDPAQGSIASSGLVMGLAKVAEESVRFKHGDLRPIQRDPPARVERGPADCSSKILYRTAKSSQEVPDGEVAADLVQSTRRSKAKFDTEMTILSRRAREELLKPNLEAPSKSDICDPIQNDPIPSRRGGLHAILRRFSHVRQERSQRNRVLTKCFASQRAPARDAAFIRISPDMYLSFLSLFSTAETFSAIPDYRRVPTAASDPARKSRDLALLVVRSRHLKSLTTTFLYRCIRMEQRGATCAELLSTPAPPCLQLPHASHRPPAMPTPMDAHALSPASRFPDSAYTHADTPPCTSCLTSHPLPPPPQRPIHASAPSLQTHFHRCVHTPGFTRLPPRPAPSNLTRRRDASFLPLRVTMWIRGATRVKSGTGVEGGMSG
ncbi:hypothetical protein B0H11DRAFT_2200308 [Mycena galericulata]|nr:hypothetical protein B0H11DRAFT_2200308 [Mycena galericulata]